MKNSIVLFSTAIAMAGLFFACNPEVKSTDDQKSTEVQSFGEDIGITLSILYCTADDFDKKLVCIQKPGDSSCPNCGIVGGPTGSPNAPKPKAKRGNLLLKYVMEKNTLNLYGWSYELKESNKSGDFEEYPNIKLSIGAAIPTVTAGNGTQLGDLIWAYNIMQKIYCENQGAKRKKFILLVPTNYDLGGTNQVKWSAFKTDQDPSGSGFKFDPMDITSFEPLDGEPNPIPPKSFNTETGDN